MFKASSVRGKKEILGVVLRAAEGAIAESITASDSRQVTELIESYLERRVRVYGAIKNGFIDRTGKRTEIDLQEGMVVVHKNLNPQHVGAERFSEVEVVVGENRHSLQIKVAPQTSSSNPLYYFFDGETKIGDGYGQRMDITLAFDLLDDNIPTNSDYVSQNVVQWIQSKLGARQ